MATDLPPSELRSLREFLELLERSCSADITAEEAIDLWRAQISTDESRCRDVSALREAITDMEGSDVGTPFDQFVDNFRKKHDIARDA